MNTDSPTPTTATRGVLLLLLYPLVAGLPLIAALVERPQTGEDFWTELGMTLGLAAVGMIAAQFALSARWHWVERPFGLDAVLRFHRAMGTLAFALLVAHPILLAVGHGSAKLLYSLDVHWYIWLGRAALLLLLVHIAISIWRKAFSLTFEQWRAAHDVLALTILGLVFVHSWFAGDEDVATWPVKTLWVVLPLAAAAVYVDSRFLRPMRLRKRAYTVTEVVTEAPGVWTVKLAPPAGAARYDYRPGQFQFLTFHRGRDLPAEEHHWTISSSPTETGVVASTIKDSGDFTSTIGRTKVGDTATVEAPFGRFSYTLHDGPRDLVCVVGGIGITPVRAMIRHLADRGDGRRVLLLYGNKTRDDIVFRDEFDALAAGDAPRLKVVHVLSKPADGWDGETGRIDLPLIERHCAAFFGEGGLGDKTFLVCGPSKLLTSTIAGLKERGVAAADIQAEAYSLAGGAMPADRRGNLFRLAKYATVALVLLAVVAVTFVRAGGEEEREGHEQAAARPAATTAPGDGWRRSIPVGDAAPAKETADAR